MDNKEKYQNREDYLINLKKNIENLSINEQKHILEMMINENVNISKNNNGSFINISALDDSFCIKSIVMLKYKYSNQKYSIK